MSGDPETLRVYAAQARDYARLTARAGDDPALAAFIARLPRGASVLDLGCGPGHAAAHMAASGLRVEAVDASPEMAALAARHAGVTARVADFDAIAGHDVFDGIWASFSLLHAPRAALPGHLQALRRALRPGGVFHIGMKTGTGARRDRLGRLYTYYSETELDALLRAAGFTPATHRRGRDLGLDGRMADWVTVLCDG